MATKKEKSIMDWENAAASRTLTVFYRTLNVEGLEIFYREAGPWDAPVVLLLHGFPSSSHMFRNLIPMLADKYHVVVPGTPSCKAMSDRKCLRFFYDAFENGTYEFKSRPTHRKRDRDCPSVRTVCARSFLSIGCG